MSELINKKRDIKIISQKINIIVLKKKKKINKSEINDITAGNKKKDIYKQEDY